MPQAYTGTDMKCLNNSSEQTLQIESVSWPYESPTGLVVLRTTDGSIRVSISIPTPEDYDAYHMERVAGVTLSFDDLIGHEYSILNQP